MNSNQHLENTEDFFAELSPSVEDFIKQLEIREKNLHIAPDLVIEIEESDLAEPELPDFLNFQPPVVQKTPPQTSNVFIPNSKTFSELESEVEDLKIKIAQAETKTVQMTENFNRRQRDFDNYKNRIERERSEIFVANISNLAMQMLPVLDNLNRALDFAADEASAKTKEFEQFFQGIFLVNQQLNEVLAGMGVMPIASVGERFDPHYHEAVALEETAEFPPHTVSAEFLRGYLLGERVIRPSMVKVATKASLTETAPVENDASGENQPEAE